MFIIYVAGNKMEKELLLNMLNENKSMRQIAKITGSSLGSIRYWVQKYELEKKKISIARYVKLLL